MKTRLCFLACLSCAWATAGLAPKETYQPIIDAKPFGDSPGAAAAASAETAETQRKKEDLAQKFRMCGITDMPDGTRKIAFLDETTGQTASYLLAVGESQNGFTLVSADYLREYATLEKDGLTFTLGLGKGLIDAPDLAEAESEPETPVEAATPRPAVASRALPPSKSGAAPGNFKARLLKRQQAREQAAAEQKAEQERAASAEAAAKAKAERRAQIERIKQGLEPTVPIVLTPEEDAELEAAGVFRQPQPAESPAAQESVTDPEAPAPQEAPEQEAE